MQRVTSHLWQIILIILVSIYVFTPTRYYGLPGYPNGFDYSLVWKLLYILIFIVFVLTMGQFVSNSSTKAANKELKKRNLPGIEDKNHSKFSPFLFMIFCIFITFVLYSAGYFWIILILLLLFSLVLSSSFKQSKISSIERSINSKRGLND